VGWISKAQQQRDHRGLRDVCAADGRKATKADPLTRSDDGFRIHRSHTTDPGSGYHGREQK